MERRSWRSKSNYAHLDAATGDVFAWELLRRNGTFRKAVIGRAADDPSAAGVARTWGLSFRGRSRPIR